MEKYQLINDNLDRQLNWIGRADARLAFIIPLNLSIIGAFCVAIELSKTSNKLYVSTLAIGILFSLASLIYCYLTALPRTKARSDKSLIYFGNINKLELEEFVDEILTISQEDLIKDLATQAYINAEIANAKFKTVKIAQGFLLAAAIAWLVSLFFFDPNKIVS